MLPPPLRRAETFDIRYTYADILSKATEAKSDYTHVCDDVKACKKKSPLMLPLLSSPRLNHLSTDVGSCFAYRVLIQAHVRTYTHSL